MKRKSSLPKTTRYDPSPGSAMEPLDIYTLGAQPALCPVCNSRYEEEQIPQEDGAYVGHCCCTRCNHRFIVEEAILRNYWLINHRTKQYTPMHNIENDFFDGDWKEKTPFASEDYIDLDCKTVWPDQKANEYLFYSYDLCRDGMLVGVFYDEDRISKEEVNAFVSTLRRKQDVAFLRNYSLKLYTQKGK